VGRAEVLDDSVLPTRLVRDLHGCGARRGGDLAHKRAHSPMIRLKLVTQTREAQRPDQDECARRDQKPHLPVQVRTKVSMFVATLPYSGMIFAYGCLDEKLAAWCDAHRRAFEYFGGVAQVVIPDNASTASNQISKYDK